jgi:hypothetical protein
MNEAMPAASPRRQANSVAAEKGFRDLVTAQGGAVVGEYINANEPVLCLCGNGHRCRPRPHHVLRGTGICRICAGQDPAYAEAAFRARVAELGGVVVGRYAGKDVPVACVCKSGHECKPVPGGVRDGGGICRRCAGLDPRDAENRFRARVTEMGGVVAGEYVNSHTPVLCICSSGHRCTPRPNNLHRRGFCRTCAGQDPAAAEASFRLAVTRQGGQVLGAYVNSVTPVHVRCLAGHDCWTTQDHVKGGGGICRSCSGKDPATAEAAFRARVAALGGAVIGSYVNCLTPVHVRCRAGHSCWPWPSSIRRGQGLCRSCWFRWDAFYLVTSDVAAKVGVTSGNPRARLADHRRDGYSVVVRLLSGLPDGLAHALECDVLRTLKLAGCQPLSPHREYFDISALPVMLDVVDNYPGVTSAMTAAGSL